MTQAFRLLLTSVGGSMSGYTIQQFLNSTAHQVDVVGVDARHDAVGKHFATVFETVPPGDAPEYADAVFEIIRRHNVDLVLPCSDEETIALSMHAEAVKAAGATLAISPPDAIEIMSDKLKTAKFLDRIGVPAPEWRLATSENELFEALDELRERHASLAVKPTQSRGSRDVYVIEKARTGYHQPSGHRECYLDIDTFKNLIDGPTDDAPLLVMQGLDAPAHDTDILCSNGKLLSAIPRLRHNKAGVPFTGGTIQNNADLIDIANKVTAGLNANWLFDIDTMSDEDGNPRVIEINCRPSGSLSAAAGAGAPILDQLISLAKGEDIEQTELPDGRSIIPYSTIKIV